MIHRRDFLRTAISLAFLAWKGNAQARETPLRLGTLPVVSARTAFDIYHPLVAYLETALGRPVQMETPPDFPTMWERLKAGAYDILVSPPHFARLAQKERGWYPLAQCEPPHHAQLLALKPNGPVNLDALRGGTIAVLDTSALVVIMVSQELARKGLEAGRDFKLLVTHSYESSLLAVKQGLAQALVVRSQGFLSPEDRERAQVLLDAGPLPGYVFIAAPNMPEPQRLRLKDTLLIFAATPGANKFLDKLGYEKLSAVSEEAMRYFDPYLGATREILRKKP